MIPYPHLRHVSNETLNRRKGTTKIQLRRMRQDRRAAALRLRLLRGRR